jgi:hypothetical protein
MLVTQQEIAYPTVTVDRADRALRSSPFKLAFFERMRQGSVSIFQVAGDRGVTEGYTRRRLGETIAEDGLSWLIQVGMLRREVDGQGLTDSFRLTPLGWQLTEKYLNAPNAEISTATWRDRLFNFLDRWFRLPF